MRAWTAAILVVTCLTTRLGAQRGAAPRTDVPEIVTRGLAAYQAQGLGPAVDVWLVGSPIAGDGSGKAQLVGALAPLESAYGRMLGADVLDVVEIGPHVRRVYTVLRLERGPLFGSFECYQTAKGAWILPMFLLNAKAQEIFPARYLGG